MNAKETFYRVMIQSKANINPKLNRLVRIAANTNDLNVLYRLAGLAQLYFRV